jgi:predicted phage-related endonuclease
MIIVEVDQRSPEWFAARCGSLGASALHEILARTKSGYSASRANRLAALAIEQLTGRPMETFQTQAMLTGIEREPAARIAYEFYTNVDVVEVGLVRHPTIGGSHVSPDGLVGEDGLLEIKSPQPAQHLATLMGEPIADKYIAQVQWAMACTGRAWADFVSYNPDFPESMQLFIQRVERDDKRIAELEAEVVDFLGELRLVVHRLLAKYEPDKVVPGELLLMAG